jgi:hypothetical protein
MARTVEHYGRLGFTFSVSGSGSLVGAGFAMAHRDGIALHFALKPDHDPARTATWVYVGVEDADRMSDEFKAAGAAQGREPRDTDYGMRELAHIDPDGNMLLFGSPLTGRAPAPGRMNEVGGPSVQAADLGRADPAAFEFAAAIRRGDVEGLHRMLRQDPGLASCIINSCTPLHLFADAPGHRPQAAGVVSVLVAAGADLNAHAIDTWHHETPLHWAASNDDVELIDALLDAGADMEHPGSSINGGPPMQSAVGYAQWAAGRRLYERGAKVGLAQAAALGLLPVVVSLVEAAAPDVGAVPVAFWNACRAGQLPVARYLLAHGAEVNWPAPWSGETPLDAATDQRQGAVVTWLQKQGAGSGS